MPSACAGGIVGQHQNARRDPRERAPGPRDDALAGRREAGGGRGGRRGGRIPGARRRAGIPAAAGAFFCGIQSPFPRGAGARGRGGPPKAGR